MSEGISLIVPHTPRPYLQELLPTFFKMYTENTVNKKLEIILIQGWTEPYECWNHYAKAARYEHICLLSDDVLVAPGWDVNMQKYLDDDSIVMQYCVEPGLIGVASQNIKMNFGRKLSEFKRKEFEDYAEKLAQEVPEVKYGEMGWYQPVMMTKTFFFGKHGGYPTERPWPNPMDMLFWERAIAKGAKLVRARSFSYHFQNMSNPSEDYKRESEDYKKVEIKPVPPPLPRIEVVPTNACSKCGKLVNAYETIDSATGKGFCSLLCYSKR